MPMHPVSAEGPAPFVWLVRVIASRGRKNTYAPKRYLSRRTRRRATTVRQGKTAETTSEQVAPGVHFRRGKRDRSEQLAAFKFHHRLGYLYRRLVKSTEERTKSLILVIDKLTSSVDSLGRAVRIQGKAPLRDEARPNGVDEKLDLVAERISSLVEEIKTSRPVAHDSPDTGENVDVKTSAADSKRNQRPATFRRKVGFEECVQCGNLVKGLIDGICNPCRRASKDHFPCQNCKKLGLVRKLVIYKHDWYSDDLQVHHMYDRALRTSSILRTMERRTSWQTYEERREITGFTASEGSSGSPIYSMVRGTPIFVTLCNACTPDAYCAVLTLNWSEARELVLNRNEMENPEVTVFLQTAQDFLQSEIPEKKALAQSGGPLDSAVLAHKWDTPCDVCLSYGPLHFPGCQTDGGKVQTSLLHPAGLTIDDGDDGELVLHGGVETIDQIVSLTTKGWCSWAQTCSCTDPPHRTCYRCKRAEIGGCKYDPYEVGVCPPRT